MNRIIIPVFFLLCPVAGALAAGPTAPGPVPIDAYVAVGSSFARDNRLHLLGWSEAQLDAFLRGIRATFQGSPRPLDAHGQALLNDIAQRLQEIDREEVRRRFGSEAFSRPGYLGTYLKDMRKRFDLQASDSGLSFAIRSSGYGARPEPGDTVIISYKVNAADLQTELAGLGQERTRVKIADVLPGLAEALQMMSIGNSAMLILPPDLSYGEGEWPAGVERGTPLIFAVVLHEIVTPP